MSISLIWSDHFITMKDMKILKDKKLQELPVLHGE